MESRDWRNAALRRKDFIGIYAMKIDTRMAGDVLVVDMDGRLDTQTSGDASDELVRIAQSGNGKVVLNLEKPMHPLPQHRPASNGLSFSNGFSSSS